jgi:hypothetical protein
MQRIGVWVILAAVATMSGCGGSSDAPELVAATGTVTYNDKPISGANVTFVVQGSPLSIGITNAEGKFSMTTGGRPGAPRGDAKVGIAKTAAAAEDRGAMAPEDMRKMQMESKNVTPGVESEIPAKYGNPETSKLVATLDADGSKNDFVFILVD